MAEVNWGMGIMPNIGGNALAAFERGQEMGRQRKAQQAYATYATNPDDPNALNALAQYDPKFVVERKQQMVTQQKATQDDQRKQMLEGAKMLGEAAMAADTPEKWDATIDYLAQYYPQVAQYKGKFSPQLREATIASTGEMKAYLEQGKAVNVGPGSHLVDPRTGKPIFSAPFAPRPVTLSEGQTAFDYRPGTGDKMTVDALRPLFVAQESGGNYSAVNSETGAMGKYQIMPQTGQGLASRLGVPWRPDLMTANTPEAQQYQDQLGTAMIQDVIDQSGGDPATAFSLYYGGPDRSKWGPKTRKYTQEMMARLGNGGAPVIARGAPKPEKQKWRQLSPDEVAQRGLPPGVYQEGPDGEVKPLGGKDGGKGSAQEQARGAQMALQAAGVSGGKDPVSALIRKSTSGRLQAGAARLWSDLTGDSTDGMEAIARLKTIGNDMVLQASGGSLGAQISNSDRDFMAARFGDIGNPDLTVDERLAAWDQVKKRLNALANSAQQAPAQRPAAKPAAKKPTVSNW